MILLETRLAWHQTLPRERQTFSCHFVPKTCSLLVSFFNMTFHFNEFLVIISIFVETRRGSFFLSFYGNGLYLCLLLCIHSSSKLDTVKQNGEERKVDWKAT